MSGDDNDLALNKHQCNTHNGRTRTEAKFSSTFISSSPLDKHVPLIDQLMLIRVYNSDQCSSTVFPPGIRAIIFPTIAIKNLFAITIAINRHFAITIAITRYFAVRIAITIYFAIKLAIVGHCAITVAITWSFFNKYWNNHLLCKKRCNNRLLCNKYCYNRLLCNKIAKVCDCEVQIAVTNHCSTNQSLEWI